MEHHSPPDPRPSTNDSSSSNPFGDSSAADTSPFIFDQFGVVTDRDASGAHPLLHGFGAGGDDHPPRDGELAQRQDDAMAGFSGASWMDVTLGNLWDDSDPKEVGDLWMG